MLLSKFILYNKMTNFSLFKSFGSFKGGSFRSFSPVLTKAFSTSSSFLSRFYSDKIVTALSNLDVNNKENFIYLKDLKLDKIYLLKVKNLEIIII
jgi:hypothetical protein